VQPSSLIFLVIVAIWVAYLIQHWVRRREHLATARSVDKFSEAMRVLERRNPLPTTVLAEAAASSGAGATSAARDNRPDVVVKHASVSSPLRARHRGKDPLPPAHPVPLIELVPHRTAAQVAMRRVRGVLFLVALAALPVTIVLSVAHVLKWLSVGIALVVLVGAVVWLRVSAIQEQQARQARRRQKRRLEEARVRVSASARPTRVVAGAATADDEDAHTPSVAEETPGGWKPVPVPPPTYTLKEPAYRPEPAPESDRPVPIEVEDDDIDVLSAGLRRRVGS
jgi:cytoskeletal protein RodZ